MSGQTVLEAGGLRFRYAEGEFELRLDALALAPGECVACVGPSGSGKSTLLSLLAGLLEPDAGSVAFLGEDWRGLRPAARRARRLDRIGLVFQEFELLEHLDVRENVLLPARLGGVLRPDPAARARAEELAARVGIGDLLGRRPARLSMGERQRVAVARALLASPSLILADEATGNLDRANARAVTELITSEARGADAALLFVTHDLSNLDLFDRVLDLGADA